MFKRPKESAAWRPLRLVCIGILIGLSLSCGRAQQDATPERLPAASSTVAQGAALPTSRAEATPTMRPPASGAGSPIETPAQPAGATPEALLQTPTTLPAAGLAVPPSQVIGYIRIPRIGLDAPIVEVSWRLTQIDGQTVGQWDAVAGAVGHHRGTASLGDRGNCVLSGHSRAEEGGVFARLVELVPGDEVTVMSNTGIAREYVVESLRKLAELGASLQQRRENARYGMPAAEDRLTLITCWPDWAYTHRIVVIARPR